MFWFDNSPACNKLCVVGELKSLRAQSVSEVGAFSGYVEMKVSQAYNSTTG